MNLAARMEQTSLPGKIRVTDDFYKLVCDTEVNWEEHSRIAAKNMGEIDTHLLDPMKDDNMSSIDDILDAYAGR